MLFIKNVILYDNFQNVVGFAELKNVDGYTAVRARHNFSGEIIVTVNNEIVGDKIDPQLNLEGEVIVCLVQKDGRVIQTVASGIINPAPSQTTKAVSKSLAKAAEVLEVRSPISRMIDAVKHGIDRTEAPKKTAAAREVDEVLRAVCQIDEHKKGMCESCPYRDFFYGDHEITAGLDNQKELCYNEN